MSSNKSAEDFKELGNQAFVAKEFETAIGHYTKAIQLDPKNHVYFSNRSASYAGLEEYEKAMEDAKECIRLEPQFMKGYYRLATVQLELEDYDKAMATIKQGLTLDANNTQLLKVMRSIKQAKKAASQPVTNRSQYNGSNALLDGAASQELRDLQMQQAETTREYQKVQANLLKIQREHRMSQLTLEELEKHPSEGAYFKTAGKMFMKQAKSDVFSHLERTLEQQNKYQGELQQKMEFLERRLKSQEQNVQELRASK